MKRLLLILTLFIALSCSNRAEQTSNAEEKNMQNSSITEFGIPVAGFEIKEGRVKKGQFFTTLMNDLGAPNRNIYSLTQASRNTFDLKKLKIGNNYRAFYTTGENPSLAYLIYEESRTSFIVFGLLDSVFVKAYSKEVSTRLRLGEAKITTSLWDDVNRAGLNINLASKLEDIYAWSIDFFGLQKGDSFKVIYDEVLIGDEVVDIGAVYAAYFTHAGKVYDAFRYTQNDSGSVQYYNSKGENLKKAFLKAPLSFTRISSGFSYSRRHPVTRIVRPHTGVDYAAPRGTPVMSIGEGTVVQRGYYGGGGNTLKIKHNATYSSAYLHLNSFAKGIKVGSRVRQGQVIGYVGTTGLSTGPHLDFRIWRSGKPINPLKMESPPSKEIDKSQIDAFRTQMDITNIKLDSLVSAQYLDTLILKLGKR
jgi:murein DD-endopeptidase MepM/ murein hydrolase activator NlpD